MRNSQDRGTRGGIVTAVSVGAVAVGIVSGCGSSTAVEPGTAASRPAGSTVTAGPATPTASTVTTAAGTPATSRPAAGGTPAGRTLGDDGIGGLALGMSKRTATATGLVGPRQQEGSSRLCEIHTGRGGIQFVYFVAGRVSIIAVGPAIRMAEGIGVGDTYQELHAKYPEAIGDGMAKVLLDAPGAKVDAHYRIGIDSDQAYRDSKVTEIALQADDQSCYE